MQAYCDEFAYRFNSRKMKDNDRFELTLQSLTGRLTYAELIAEPKEEDHIPFTQTGE